MKLYRYFYEGITGPEFHVLAETRGRAEEAVERYIEKERKKEDSFAEDWGTQEYTLIEYDPGEVSVIIRE